MNSRKYNIIKNCFAGRKGYTLTLDADSQRAKRLVKGGFIEPQEAEQPKKKNPKADKRQKKIVKPDETK